MRQKGGLVRQLLQLIFSSTALRRMRFLVQWLKNPTILFGCGFLSILLPVEASQNSWTGAGGDHLWTNAANWSLGLPNSLQDVSIVAAGTNPVILNVLAAVDTLSLGGPQGSAVLNIAAGSLHCYSSGLIRTNGILNLTGTLTTEASFEVDGTFNWSGGMLKTLGPSVITIGSVGSVNIAAAGSNVLSGKIMNNGTVSCFSTNLFALYSSYLINSNLFVLHSNLSLAQSLPGSPPVPEFQNAGTILLPGGSGTNALNINWKFSNTGAINVGTNAVLEVRPNDFNLVYFQSGTVFDGSGIVRFPNSGYYISWDGAVRLNATIECNANSIYGNPVWTGPGLFRWQSGGMNSFTFAPDFHVEITGSAFLGSACTNRGTVRWLGSNLGNGANAAFVNSGLFIIETNCAMTQNADPRGSFINLGTILEPAGSGTLSVTIDWNFTNHGTINVGSDAVLEVRPNGTKLVNFQAGTIFDGAGVVRFPYSGNYFAWDGTMTLNGTIEYNGFGIYGSPIWTGPGLFRWQSGGMSSFTFAPGFHVEMGGGSGNVATAGACTNQGTVRWIGDNFFYSGSGATFNNSGLLIIETNCNWDQTILFNNLPGGILREISGQSFLATLNNNGTVELDGGALNLTTNSVASGGTNLWALGAYTGFGQLSAQNLALDGALLVTLTNGFVPTNGSVFLLASFAARSGQFPSVMLPILPTNLTWRVQYAPTTMSLKVVPTTTSLISPARLVNGAFQLTLAGPDSSAYEIQASTNLLQWVTIESNSPFLGTLVFTDTNAGVFPRRFYRGLIFD
jgi:hypothetical protein